MEHNNLTNKNEEKVESLETKGERISDLEKPQESFEDKDKQVSVVDDAEEVLKLELELKKIEEKSKATLEAINKVHAELGIDQVNENIETVDTNKFPALKLMKNKFLAMTSSLKNLGKAATVAGLMMGATSEGLSQNKSEKDSEKEHKEWVEKSYKLYKQRILKEDDIIKSPDGSLYKISSLDKKTSKKDSSLEGGEQKTSLNISQFFKTGTTEFINSQAEQNAKESLRDFLKNADLKNFKINVLGTYSIDRAYEHNQELAEARRDLGYKILLEVLKEKYSPEEISKIVIEAQAKGKSLLDSFTQEKIDEMSRAEKDKAIDANQGISFKLEFINKKREIKELVFQKTFNNIEDFNNVAAVIVDNSNSMREDLAQVSDFIQKINLENKKLNKESIGVFTVAGKDKEAHLNTIISVLSRLEKKLDQKEIVLITDEPDNQSKGEEYNKKIEQILKDAKEKNIKIVIKILNSTGGTPFKIFVLDEKNKDALLSNSRDDATWFASLEDRP